MPHDRSAWFRAPDDSDVEDFIDIEECAETPPRRSRLRWALGTAVALVIPAGAFALVPSGRAPPAAAA
jgi:hypothetical protein